MNPLPDRVVILGLLITLGLCFALVFWSVRLNPRPEPPLQWRENTAPQTLDRRPQPSLQLL
ncbi:hypothetical protein KBY57_01845 [Cyanobium sp. Aljojuca 7D2]|jgi:hypothetical protein|uniref:hypothetical protein n=1 Tax=Cyanobium sp. Aljojuca 7D2 TaxID=2823698 RepID=UPI0020CE300E|nr:hypothetical protein [Cyanobium sp. Aljojuca 7D2]MCP9889801.1 hypothetical protein [Cyanobium sp. Aljojuca 7D2]